MGRVPWGGSGSPIGDCNSCHTQVSGNDYVWDSALQFTNF
jgi:hypothetical protein